MSTTYTNFSAIDFRGNNSLSAYALENTPLTFIPDLPNNSIYRIVWNFGDGTISKAFSAAKSYTFPGIYTVNMVVYNCDSNAMISTFEKTITIVDYIPFTFNIEFTNYIVTENGSYISTSIDNIHIKVGSITGPWKFNAYYPTYQTPSDIFCYTSGSNSDDWWSKNNKFQHLENTYSLYDKIYNYSLKSNQYREIDRLQLSAFKLYSRIVNNELVSCSETDIGAFYVGQKASKEIYIKDDSISNQVLYKFFFDKTNNPQKYVNNLGITLSATIINNTPNHLSITSNGLDGEGYPIQSFDINPIKFYNTKIPFVVKIKDNNGFSIKNFDKIALSSLNVSINGANTSQYSISSLNYTLESQDSGGALRGYVTFPNVSSNAVLSGVYISASGTLTNKLLSSYTLLGNSTPFNVYPSNNFDYYKTNENFNAEQTLKDLRFQETLLDKELLFGGFLGGILGGDTATHEAIGLKSYEKIANFVQNTQDLDKCEIGYIDSLGQTMNYNDTRAEKYHYPERIKRLINTLSIDKSKLVGTSNKFRENLDIKGRTSKTEYGINIGNKINTTTYTITAGTPIVALEKFSNTYNLLNTFQPVSSTGSTIYKLSAYNSNWGWPMVLPAVFNFKEISKYYLFFEYNDQYDGTILDGVIDFTNNKTTIPSTVSTSDMISQNGIMDNMFLDTLYQSLSLVQ